jgi:hypothetical protein
VPRKVVYAGAKRSSFEPAGKDLREQAERTISASRIMRATKPIGGECIEQREAEIETWRQLPLPDGSRAFIVESGKTVLSGHGKAIFRV